MGVLLVPSLLLRVNDILRSQKLHTRFYTEIISETINLVSGFWYILCMFYFPSNKIDIRNTKKKLSAKGKGDNINKIKIRI